MLSSANYPVRFRAQLRTKLSVARYSSWSIVSQLKVSPRLYQTDLRISNHRGHKFPPSLTLLSFIKTRIEWPPRLTETASFQSLCFQLLQCSRQRPSFSAHRAALMTKSDLTFPAFSLRSVDFAAEFCFYFLITWAGLARLAGLVWVCRDLGMSVKRNKNQLRDYMTTGSARTKPARLTGPARLM